MLKQESIDKGNNRFAQLLNDYEYVRPKRGEFYDAEVMMVAHDRILVDIGAKTDGVVTPRELSNTDEDLIANLSEGDRVSVYVKTPPSMLRKTAVSIQKGAEKASWDQAQSLMETGKPVELEVTGKNKGGLLVRLGRLRGFVPTSLVPVVSRFSSRRLRDKVKENLVGEKLLLYVVQADPVRNKLIFSMREDTEQIEAARLEQLHAGDVVEGIVVNIADYGVFVHLMGVDGLMHISQISWERVEDAAELFSIGDKVEVEVLEVDREEKRVQLSQKRLLPTPGLSEFEDIAVLAEAVS